MQSKFGLTDINEGGWGGINVVGIFKIGNRLCKTLCVGKRDSSLKISGGGGVVGEKILANVSVSLSKLLSTNCDTKLYYRLH